MGILGTLLNFAVAIYMVYFGYTGDTHYTYLLIAPVGFMIGHILRRREKSSTIYDTRNNNILVALVKSYLVGIILAAVFYGVGIGIDFMLDFRPAEGTGRL